jgi:hypothetical protein
MRMFAKFLAHRDPLPGRRFKSFSPAVSEEALKKMINEIKRLRIHRRVDMRAMSIFVRNFGAIINLFSLQPGPSRRPDFAPWPPGFSLS